MNRRWHLLGLAIIALGLLFLQPLFIVIGLLAAFVSGMTDLWLTFCLRDLTYQRQFSEQRALFGETVTLSILLENAKMLPLPWVEIEDTVPRALPITGQRMRVSLIGDSVVLDNLFSIRWYERVTRRYTVSCNARGVHKFGPTTVRSGDVFGFLSHDETLNNWQYLLVYPLVAPITRFGLPSRHPFGDRRAPRRLLEDPSRVIGVRDYAYGDSLRRVHWKATARTMQLQSKIYEASTTYTLILFLNASPQFDLMYGLNPAHLELAISAAASVADWALNEGFSVGLYANTLMFLPETGMLSPAESKQGTPPEGTTERPAAGNAQQPVNMAGHLQRRRIHLPPSSSQDQRRRIMETLARVQPYFGNSFEDMIQTERSRLPAGSTAIAITSTISEPLLESLVRVRQGGHAVSILFAGDAALSGKMASIPVHHLGGEETWNGLVASFGGAASPSGTTSDTPRLPDGTPAHIESTIASHMEPEHAVTGFSF